MTGAPKSYYYSVVGGMCEVCHNSKISVTPSLVLGFRVVTRCGSAQTRLYVQSHKLSRLHSHADFSRTKTSSQQQNKRAGENDTNLRLSQTPDALRPDRSGKELHVHAASAVSFRTQTHHDALVETHTQGPCSYMHEHIYRCQTERIASVPAPANQNVNCSRRMDWLG